MGELNEQQIKTALYTVRPHRDIELDTNRINIDYYASRPSQMNDETGVILSIPGFGTLSNSPYMIQKLYPY
jgi:hypothetical protein